MTLATQLLSLYQKSGSKKADVPVEANFALSPYHVYMTYLDQDDAVKLVKKYREIFESLASRDTFESDIKSGVSKAQLVFLLLRAVAIGAVWWLLSLVDPIYGTLFLLMTAMIQAKLMVDQGFAGVSDRIIEVAKSEGILAETRNCKKCNVKNQTEESEED